MKPDIRWQALLALAGLALVMMLLSYQVQSAALCTASVPVAGGTFVEGIVGRPYSLNPLLSDPYPVDREIANLIYDGLVSFDETGQAVPALAESWTISEDGLTITFELRDGLQWHDGQPVSIDDVAFTYGLMQSDDFPGSPALKNFWQSVTITPLDDRLIAFTTNQPYAPFFEAVTRGVLPAHLLGDVNSSDLASMPFNQAPVGTGPFLVQAGQDWQQTGRLRLSPNPSYWREGTQINDVEFRFFADAADLLSAFRGGEVNGINRLPATLTPEAVAEQSARIFSSTAPRYSALFFNLSDAGSPALASKEVRQAIAYAIDRNALINTVLNGQGVIFEGPYLPDTWFGRPEQMTSYTYQPETAASLLDAAGWAMGDGGRTREGQTLALRLVAIDDQEPAAVANELVRQLSNAGIDTQLSLTPNIESMRALLAERNFDLALLEIIPSNDPDLYDFWSQDAMVRGQNYSSWNNRRASEALEAGRQIFNQNERISFYEAFLRQFDTDLPAFTLYQHVSTYVLSDKVIQAEVGRVWQPRERYRTLPTWFLNYRDITVSCPAEAVN